MKDYPSFPDRQFACVLVARPTVDIGRGNGPPFLLPGHSRMCPSLLRLSCADTC
jgi:hypothetical protein